MDKDPSSDIVRVRMPELIKEVPLLRVAEQVLDEGYAYISEFRPNYSPEEAMVLFGTFVAHFWG